MYKKVSTNMNFVEKEKEVLKFWNDNEVFEKSKSLRAGGPVYTFYDGPPTANGKPHIGHVKTRAIKDLLPRYKMMKGYQVLRKAGWDTHGLPVEIEVEKQEGIDGKDQIEAFGLEPFIKLCKESVWKYKGMWEQFSDTVGFWLDMDNPYITYENEYIESVWWSLKQIWEKGLLYKGHKIVPYCPRCGTPLSSHEVAQGYKDVTEESLIAKFKSKGEDNVYYLAWTTTPWTLPSNVALCVNAKEEYIKAKKGDEYFIMARELAPSVLGDFEVVETFTGKELEYKEYEPLFDYYKGEDKAFIVTCDDYVTLTDGTGIVHNAPAFGEDDQRVCKLYELPFLQYVDLKGEFTNEVTDYAGKFVKDCDKLIIEDLRKSGKLYEALHYEHSYPHCWRCDTPLLYYAKDAWYIEMTKVKDDLLSNNAKINWYPEYIGKKRFGDWLENVMDWGLSRDRYWGTPLNIWECENGHFHSVGSIKELKELSDNCPEDIELHRPFIDEVTFPCKECNATMNRVSQVIDCWYDSGAMPFAQWHYPFENKEIFDEHYPADFISEAVDQTRGWFYSLLAISTLIFDEPAYKNVIVMGHVQDENGQKMSKSKGNAVDPFEALEKYSADAIRWYFYNNSAPWLPNRFGEDAVVEGQRKFMGTLLNTYAFYILYADIDEFDPTKYELKTDELPVMDRWLLSRLNTVIKEVDEGLDSYKITEPARVLSSFVDEISNWYVRRSRERFWEKGMERDKINAYMTLYTALRDVAILSAPMIPFLSERIYQNLVRTNDKKAPLSVHYNDYPKCDERLIDPEIEKSMDKVLKIVINGRSARNGAAMKNRQPLKTLFVKGVEGGLADNYIDIVKEELNIKEVVFTEDLSAFTTYKFKPQLRTVGPKYGKLLGKIQGVLKELDGNKAYEELNEKGNIEFEVEGSAVILGKEDLLIEQVKKEGFETVSDGSVTVVLDIRLTKELIEEGYVRELISKIQTMRKEADFNVIDKIDLVIKGDEEIEAVLENNAGQIADETLAQSVNEKELEGYSKGWNINGKEVTIVVAKV